MLISISYSWDNQQLGISSNSRVIPRLSPEDPPYKPLTFILITYHFPCLSNSKPLFFKHSFTYPIHLFCLWSTYQMTSHILPFVISFQQSYYSHSFDKTELSENTHSPLSSLHIVILPVHQTLSILLILNKRLKIVHQQSSIPRSFLLPPYHCLTTIQQNGHDQCFMQCYCILSLQIPNIHQRSDRTCSFSSTHHLAPCVPDSSKIHPKYLNPDTYSNHISSTKTSHIDFSSPPNTNTLLYSPSTFRPFLHTSIECPTIIFRSFSDSWHKNNSYVYIIKDLSV